MQHLDEGMIHAWLDGQLPQSEAQAVEEHVAECRPCADAVAEARGLIAASSRILMALDGVPRGVAPEQADSPADAGVGTGRPEAVPVDAAPNAVIDLRSRVPARSPAAQRTHRRWLSGPALAAAATILVAVGTFTIWQSRSEMGPLAATADRAAPAGPSVVESGAESPAGGARTPAAVPVPASPSANAPSERANEAVRLSRTAVAEPNARSVAGLRDQAAQDAAPPSLKAGATVANAPPRAREEAKQEASETRRVDELARAKERNAFVSADSIGTRQRLGAVAAATPPPQPQARPDTSRVTVFRGAKVEVAPADQRAARDVAQASPASVTTGTIQGRVTDGNSTGLEGAQVKIAGISIGAMTNERGEFTLSGVPLGDRRLEVRRIGFDMATDTVTVAAGRTATADIVIRPSTTTLSSVVVTGSGSEQGRRAAGSARAPAPVPAREAAPREAAAKTQSNAIGCYELGITSNNPGQPARTALVRIPRRVALDGEIVPASAEGGWYRARDLAPTGAMPNGVWRPVGADGVEVEWTYGTRVARLRLTGAPAAMMRGTVEDIDRAAGTVESGTVVSSRRACDG